MSKIAQETARLVEEMRKKEWLKAPKAAKPKKGETMDENEPVNEPPADEGDGLEALLDDGGAEGETPTSEEIVESDAAAATSATDEGGASDMSKKKRSKKKSGVWKAPAAPKAEKKAKKVKAPKAAKAKKAAKPKAAKKAKADGAGRVTLVYKVIKSVTNIKDGTAAHQIIKAIEKRGEATKKELAKDLGSKFPDPTLRFNLWTLTTKKILSAK